MGTQAGGGRRPRAGGSQLNGLPYFLAIHILLKLDDTICVAVEVHTMRNRVNITRNRV